MEKLNGLKFTGGNITDFIDFEKSFGNLLYIGHEPVFKFEGDGTERVRTDEVIGYEMIVASDKSQKTYKVKFDDAEVDLSGLVMEEIVELEGVKVVMYNGTSRTRQGIEVSISASGIVKHKAQHTLRNQHADQNQPKANGQNGNKK